MPQTATITSLPAAYRMLKSMQVEGIEWGEDYRSAAKVVRAYARRAGDLDRMLLACFILGLSTRKVTTALLPVLGRPVSPATVSAVAKQLDAAVAAFHRRPLRDHYRVLVLDGVVLKRKTGAGALAGPSWSPSAFAPTAKRRSSTFA